MEHNIYTLLTKRINVKENEAIVLQYLHSKGIEERGNILSPTKEIWFKHCHYIRFIDVPVANRPTLYWLAYTYTDKSTKHQGQVLGDISIDELKTILDSNKKYRDYRIL